jgi:hypothetical protein
MQADASNWEMPRHSILHSASRLLPSIWRLFLGPMLFYVAWFFFLTFPLVLQFNAVFFTDREDGYQMIWDLWLVRRAILHLHQNPFSTRMVEFPHGTSLLLHSLMPFNGLLSIPLMSVLTEIQAFNVLVVLAFAGSGLTSFWLCLRATRGYWPSLAGGFSFAFCGYRWAHYHGHLPLISSQWMVLYLLGLLCMLATPRIATAIATAIVLLVVLLCDQYHFLFCVLATAVVFLWWALKWVIARGEHRSSIQGYIPAFAAFVATATFTCGPLVLTMIREAGHAPLLRTHDPDLFSADLIAPWVPDWTWLYGNLTSRIWMPLLTAWPYIDKGVCLGPAAVVAAIFAFLPGKGRPRLALGSTALLAALAVLFLFLSFGPIWRFWTVPITGLTPYRGMVALFPPLRFAGSVSRFIVVTQLALSVLAAAGISRIVNLRSGARRALLIILLGVSLVIESQPEVPQVCPPVVPEWVLALRDAPGQGAVIDLVVGDRPIDLYYQTIHHRPIAMGNVSRLSADTAAATATVLDAAHAGRYDLLGDMGFGFLVTYAIGCPLHLPIIYADQAARIYRLPARSQRMVPK